MNPAVYPPSLKPTEELDAARHPGDAPPKESRKRKRLTFDEVSNVILEGIGDGPLRTAKCLEKAAKTLKDKGQVELWNYVGALKTAAEIVGLVGRVWNLNGQIAHPMYHIEPQFPLDAFSHNTLQDVQEWRGGKWKTHVLVLSGDGGLGKTNLGEALIAEKCPGGFWFVDDPDDFRELEGLVEPGQGILVDEITLADFHPNQIKKLYDIEKTRRVKCRHFNATIPKGCPRIFCTNSSLEQYYPVMKNSHDRTGVFRRHLWQVVRNDVRVLSGADSLAPFLPVATSSGAGWQDLLAEMCEKASVGHHLLAALRVAENLGVALASEIAEVATEIADGVGMKALERKRFLKQ